jgi:surfactin synthase thioesterase subunit
MEKANLICFPYAGGSKFSYNKFAEVAPGNLTLIPIELPGRGARFDERLIYNADELVDKLFHQIKSYLFDPYAIYGHSMGSLIGYLITKRIIKENLPQPLHLFFSGAKAPHMLQYEPAAHLFEKEELIASLRKMGGIPERILKNDNLMRILEPIVRADFRVINTYVHKDTEAMDIPISVIIGSEEGISLEQSQLWQKETIIEIKVDEFQGDHFFIFHHAEQLMALIHSRLMENILESRSLYAMTS